jgi:hypothetical protein
MIYFFWYNIIIIIIIIIIINYIFLHHEHIMGFLLKPWELLLSIKNYGIHGVLTFLETQFF